MQLPYVHDIIVGEVFPNIGKRIKYEYDSSDEGCTILNDGPIQHYQLDSSISGGNNDIPI
jgi:hypothetical protein